MGKIIDLEEFKDSQQPHITVAAEGKVHVIPVAFFRRVISGEYEIERLNDWRPILKAILGDWLDMICERDL